MLHLLNAEQQKANRAKRQAIRVWVESGPVQLQSKCFAKDYWSKRRVLDHGQGGCTSKGKAGASKLQSKAGGWEHG